MSVKNRFVFPSLLDLSCIIFVLLIIPVGFMFHVFVVLPCYYTSPSFMYTFHLIISTYLLINLVGNYIATVMIDSSIKGEILISQPFWKLCASCECFVPPRTWHCDRCNTCILKRDHHCNFTGGCIGHRNERYFFMFLFYLTVATLYASYFNIYFMKETFDLNSWQNILKLVFPFAILLSGFDASLDQVYRIMCIVTILGLCISFGLFCYHFHNVIHGRVMYESGKDINDYDLGNWIKNVEVTLGSKWYLTWILPFVNSPLPFDGVNWMEAKLLTQKGK